MRFLRPELTRRTTLSARSIARTLYEEGLEDEELFSAMWAWHDETGIESGEIFREYRLIQGRPLTFARE